MRVVFYVSAVLAGILGGGLLWFSYTTLGRETCGLVLGGLSCGLVCGLMLAFAATDDAYRRHRAARALDREMNDRDE